MLPGQTQAEAQHWAVSRGISLAPFPAGLLFVQAGATSSVPCCAWQHSGNAKAGRLPLRHGKISAETRNRLCVFIPGLGRAYQHVKNRRETQLITHSPGGSSEGPAHETWTLWLLHAPFAGPTGRADVSKPRKSTDLSPGM